MSTDVVAAVRASLRRVASPAGLALAASFAVVGALQSVAWALVFVDGLATLGAGAPSMDLVVGPQLARVAGATGLGLPAATLLWLGTWLASLALLAVTVDAFARDECRLAVPDRRRLGRAVLHLAAASIAFGLTLWIGTVFLFLPALAFAVLFAFAPVAVVVEERTVWSACRASLDAVTENLRPSAVALAVVLASYGAQWLATVGIEAASLPALAHVVTVEVVAALIWTFAVAVLTRTYLSLDAGTSDARRVGEATYRGRGAD